MTNLRKFQLALKAMGITKDHGRRECYTVSNYDRMAITIWEGTEDGRYVDFYFNEDGTFSYMEIRSAAEDEADMTPESDHTESGAVVPQEV